MINGIREAMSWVRARSYNELTHIGQMEMVESIPSLLCLDLLGWSSRIRDGFDYGSFLFFSACMTGSMCRVAGIGSGLDWALQQPYVFPLFCFFNISWMLGLRWLGFIRLVGSLLVLDYKISTVCFFRNLNCLLSETLMSSLFKNFESE